MSKLREKSEFNIEAAILLVDNNLYAPSVHCSYYSCVQLMKYIIKDFFEIDYSEMASQISQSKSGTHVFLINYLSDSLYDNVSAEKSRSFRRSIKDLKQFREEADYEDVEVLFDKSEKSLNMAKEIIRELKEIF
jgi:uncharacterized protein (UPF0332 family)